MTEQELYRELVKSSSFKLDTLTKFLRQVRKRSFDFLYDFQVKVSKIRRFDFNASEMSKITVKRGDRTFQTYKAHSLFINESFINDHSRVKYRRSEFYDKEITMYDIANNPSIFKYAYLVFIDGKFVDSTNLYCKDNMTYLIFDTNEYGNTNGLPVSFIEDAITNDVNITIYFIPNTVYGVYNTNVNALWSYNNFLSLENFNIAGNLDTEANYLTFINDNDLLYTGVMVDDQADEFLKFYVGNDTLPYNTKQMHFNVFGIKNLLERIDLPAGEEFFELEMKDHPIVTENMIIFRELSDGKRYFAHDVTVKLNYPNIYEVTNNDFPQYPLQIYCSYFDDTPEFQGLAYKNELKLYYDLFSTEILNKYKDGSIPDIVKNYTPSGYTYSIPNYIASDDDPNSLLYKMNKFTEFVETSPELMADYLSRLINSQRTLYIDLSTLDLTSKIRVDNNQEISNEDYHADFIEDHYMFRIENFNGSVDTRLGLYIDGLFYDPTETYVEDGITYLYIPSSIVDVDSVIEIVKDPDFIYNENMIFGDINNKITLMIDNDDSPVMASDIYIVNADDNSRYVPKESYDLSIIDSFGEETVIGTGSARLIQNEVIVTLKDPALINSNLVAKVDKFTRTDEWTVDPAFGGYFFYDGANNDARYFKIYKDGRLIPTHLYYVDFDRGDNGLPYIDLSMVKEVGDVYTVSHTPNRYRQVYFSETIPASGILNLIDILERPLDFSTYEFYLNGRKLNSSHIDFLSNHQLRIKGQESLLNFEILEKNIDEDLFVDYVPSANSIGDQLMALPDVQQFILDNFPNIPDLEPNGLGVILDLYSSMITNLYLNFLKTLEYINPDVNQLDDETLEQYDQLLDPATPFLVNPDKSTPESANFQRIILNPNDTIS